METTASKLVPIVFARAPVYLAQSREFEETVFEVTAGSETLFTVLLRCIKRPFFLGIPLLEWQASFENSEMPVNAIIDTQVPETTFYSPEGEIMGAMRQEAFSVAGKTVGEDECGVVLGRIEWRLKKHVLFSGSGARMGAFVKGRSVIRKSLFPPPFIYAFERFEFVNEISEKIDWRLLYAFVAHRIWSELWRQSS